MKTEMPNQQDAAQKASSLGLAACTMHDGMYHLAKNNMNEAMLQQKKSELENEGFSFTGEGQHPNGGDSYTFNYTSPDATEAIVDTSEKGE